MTRATFGDATFGGAAFGAASGLPSLIVECAFNADAGVAYKEAILAGFPLGYWRLGDVAGAVSAIDTSGNVQTGTPTSVTFAQASLMSGDLSTAALFNGTTSQVNVPDSPGLSPTVSALTLEAIVKPTSIANAPYLITKLGSYALGITAAGRLTLQVTGTGGSASPVSNGATVIATGSVYHLAATWDGFNARFYINGVLDSTVPATFTSPNLADTANPVLLGSASGANFYSGVMQEAAVYATVLSDQTIAYHAEAMKVLTADRWVWTDLTTRTRKVATSRGRKNEQDHAATGTIEATFNNADRALEPGYVASPYYPNMLPEKPIRVRADNSVNGGTIVPIMGGNIEAVPEDWLTPEYGEVDVTAADVLALLNGDEGVSFVAPTELTGGRMKRLAQAIGVRAADLTADAGGGNIVAETLANANALSHAQEVETTEAGFVFAGKAYGTLIFKDRTARQLSHQASIATFGDGTGDATEYPYQKLNPSFDNSWLYNEVIVNALGLAAQVASDAPSRRQYRKRSLTLDTKHANVTDALNAAQLWLLRYAQPLRRIDSMVVQLTDQSPSQMVTDCLSLDLGSRITIVRRPGGVANPVISVQCNIESIAWDIEAGKPWLLTLQLSPADVTIYWSLGTTGSSELGSTTRLSF